jgi:hypothetical protein
MHEDIEAIEARLSALELLVMELFLTRHGEAARGHRIPVMRLRSELERLRSKLAYVSGPSEPAVERRREAGAALIAAIEGKLVRRYGWWR